MFGERLVRTLSKACEALAIFLLVCMALVIFTQVLLRNLFSIGPAWMEELSRSLHMVLVFITLPILTREDLHIKIDYVLNRLPGRAQRAVRVTLLAVMLGFGAVFLASCIDLMKRSGNVMMPAMNVPSIVIYVPIAIGMMIFLLTMVVMILVQLKNMKSETGTP
jgi:TRAP-type C4-dicarboxylate transport system permease small subunit